jgi:hypothetical protein
MISLFQIHKIIIKPSLISDGKNCFRASLRISKGMVLNLITLKSRCKENRAVPLLTLTMSLHGDTAVYFRKRSKFESGE